MGNNNRSAQKCWGCGELSPKWVLHHIVPVAAGGQDIPSNFAILCHPCHRKTHRIDRAVDAAEYQLERWEPKLADRVIKGVCVRRGMIITDILGPRRHSELVAARAEIAHRLKAEFHMGISAIGRALERDHSTILHYLSTRDIEGNPIQED